MSEFLVSFGARVKYLRKEKGLTQEDFAERAELQYTYISGIERRERNISFLTFQKILEALEVSPLGFFSYNKNNIIQKEKSKAELISNHKEILHTLDPDEIVILNKIMYNILEFKSINE
ncbi:helix-turn-helix domain-containing protein [Rossellomorea sp. LjRoot5]|uniref:helix-turn-helix domain-containing protein n=1 Tax=Rossellomorea sp. LjRoot5 TaxID=3342331 RepID=UPI003ECDB491